MSESSDFIFENGFKRPTFFSTPCGPVELDSLSEAGTNFYDEIQRSSVLGRP